VKRVLLAVALAVGAVVGVVALAEATQNRPDAVEAGSSSRLVLAVEGRHGPAGLADAQALWAVCHRTARSVKLTAPPVALGGGAFRLDVAPSVGPHAEKRLVGCLEDMTLDGLLGRVTSLEHAGGR